MDKLVKELLLSISQYTHLVRNFSVDGLSQGKIAVAAAAWHIYKRNEDHRIRVGEIVEELDAPASGVSRTLRELEANGTLIRVTDPQDRRSTLVAFTDKGFQQVHNCMNMVDAVFDDAIGEIGEEKAKTLCSLLQEFSGGMERAMEKRKIV